MYTPEQFNSALILRVLPLTRLERQRQLEERDENAAFRSEQPFARTLMAGGTDLSRLVWLLAHRQPLPDDEQAYIGLNDPLALNADTLTDPLRSDATVFLTVCSCGYSECGSVQAHARAGQLGGVNGWWFSSFFTRWEQDGRTLNVPPMFLPASQVSRLPSYGDARPLLPLDARQQQDLRQAATALQDPWGKQREFQVRLKLALSAARAERTAELDEESRKRDFRRTPEGIEAEYRAAVNVAVNNTNRAGRPVRRQTPQPPSAERLAAEDARRAQEQTTALQRRNAALNALEQGPEAFAGFLKRERRTRNQARRQLNIKSRAAMKTLMSTVQNTDVS